jgi:hypothetical protein
VAGHRLDGLSKGVRIARPDQITSGSIFARPVVVLRLLPPMMRMYGQYGDKNSPKRSRTFTFSALARGD